MTVKGHDPKAIRDWMMDTERIIRRVYEQPDGDNYCIDHKPALRRFLGVLEWDLSDSIGEIKRFLSLRNHLQSQNPAWQIMVSGSDYSLAFRIIFYFSTLEGGLTGAEHEEEYTLAISLSRKVLRVLDITLQEELEAMNRASNSIATKLHAAIIERESLAAK